jgi:hypothetical protein
LSSFPAFEERRPAHYWSTVSGLQYWKSTRSPIADRRAERLYSSSLDDLFAELLHAIQAFVQESGAERAVSRRIHSRCRRRATDPPSQR